MTLTPTIANRTVEYQRKRRRRASNETLFALTFGVSVALPVALYLASGAPMAWANAADVVTGLGILAGLVATQVVVMMLLLAARIPWVDSMIGVDRAISLHNQLGKPALYGLLAHGLLITVGYSMTEGIDPIAETMSLLGISDMVWAYISMGLFLAVVGTSIVAVKRKLPREWWMGVHFLSYAAVASSIPHQFSMGSALGTGTLSRWYWISLYLITASALLVFRFALPLIRSLQSTLKVSDVSVSSWRTLPSGDKVPDSWSITMTGNGVNKLEAQAGQFFRWRFMNSKLWWQQHPFSLSAAPNSRSLRITVRNLGSGSAAMGSLTPGTRVFFAGPYGLFTEAARTQPQLVLAGAGAGIGPIRSLIENADFAPGECTVLIRSSDEDSLILREEIREWCWHRGAVLYELVGHRDRNPDHALTPELAERNARSSWLPAEHARAGYTLESYAPDLSRSDVYVCGPSAWTDAVIADAKAAGLPSESLHTERFSW
ncbi:ferric reductase-like transmembrane domain-containing protein [Neomicrococcus aestuarii]|uniref:ferredoxin reductase family protein n=1 Tax=Neomicrococcus aestuarii TaxID=556325 RepID=UPI0009FCE0FF|nr:ferredoxin reductase family protein [Neomicrococcus aestuarii]